MERLILPFIFLELKIIFGMTDKQEVVVTPNTIPQEQMNADEIINNLPQIGD